MDILLFFFTLLFMFLCSLFSFRYKRQKKQARLKAPHPSLSSNPNSNSNEKENFSINRKSAYSIKLEEEEAIGPSAESYVQRALHVKKDSLSLRSSPRVLRRKHSLFHRFFGTTLSPQAKASLLSHRIRNKPTYPRFAEAARNWLLVQNELRN